MRHPLSSYTNGPADDRTRSFMFPHLYVVGGHPAMLVADVQATLVLRLRAEGILQESLKDWRTATGKMRAACRGYLARDIEAYRRASKVAAAARQRWWLDTMLRVCEREVMRDGVLVSGVRHDH